MTVLELESAEGETPTPGGCCTGVDWAAAPLVDALPDFVQRGRADWCDMTLAQAWQLGWARR